MRIGELARRSDVAPRLLRYYEQQGLIQAARAENGYREYAEEDVARAQRVAAMVRSGIPTRLVRAILDLETTPSAGVAKCSRLLAEQLASELTEIEGRIDCLAKSRDTIRGFLAQTEHSALVTPAATTAAFDQRPRRPVASG
ncbi:MerR family transcriptional regulator [Ruania zhangjianzhongii]|uniref:MerR family transcriptional regulator n=1 Tax=Ruania zhangjianzhongii TaxID=2603206 RepID=UPI0011C77397|nr:MerR family transcriptional regulator [Ruania zhangjianzhongii]